MTGNRMRSLKSHLAGIFSGSAGFSLVELLVALSVLVLIGFAFTPLLLGSIERVYFAGDKSEALHRSQSEMEFKLVEQETVDGYELVMDFGEGGETIVSVPGGLVEVEKNEGRAGAWLSSFVPFVPSINLYLAPLPLAEGYVSTPIIIMGRSTEFSKVDQLKLFDCNGAAVNSFYLDFSPISYPDGIPAGYEGVPEGYDEYARFTLLPKLTSAKSPYVVEASWEMDNEIVVRVRARLQVVLPYAVAVGSWGRILASPDAGATWNQKDYGQATFFRDVIWTGFEYVAVAMNGTVMRWTNGREPAYLYPCFDDLNGVAYGDGLLVAVGSNGTIVTTRDFKKWNVNRVGHRELRAVAWNNEEYVAVGASGTILSSPDGINWTAAHTGEDGLTFNDVAYGHGAWIAVGEGPGGAVVYSSANGWHPVSGVPGGALHGVAYGCDGFTAVGENGIIIYSSDGSAWLLEADLPVAQTIYDIVWDSIRGQYVAAGRSGVILTGSGADGWTCLMGSGTLRGVAVR